MSEEHRKKKSKFKRPGEKDVRNEKGRVMWIKIMGEKSNVVTEKTEGKGAGEVYTQCAVCVHLFRNTFKTSKMWTALKTANPKIASSVLLYPSSSCRNALPHSRFLSCRKNSCPIHSSFCILSPWNTSGILSHKYLRDWDPQHVVFRSLLSFSSFTTWTPWLQEIQVAGEPTFYC